MTATSHISTAAIGMASRLSITNLQNKLQEAQKELSTSRLADVGLTLGFRTGETISMRQEVTRLKTITDTNSVAKARLDTTDVALEGIADGASEFLGNLFLARNGGITASALADVAKAALSTFTDASNTTLNGMFLFGGINSDAKPIEIYDTTPASAAKTAVNDAFQTAFGISQSDAGVANISPADMETFLDGAFSDLFETDAWLGTWSNASDTNIKSRISTSELIDTSANANQPAFRKLAEAYTMMSDLGNASLSTDTYNVLIEKAMALINEAGTDLTRIRTDIGSAQSRIEGANDRMAIQINVLNLNVSSLEGVDPAEVSVRVSSLLTQIETAYSVTARIQNLSILNYMPS
ncbi:MAG: flagellar hook-associated family protein [Hyphomicrobiaceae bacterium]|nr:flagellar hook-associated family protein [Hyphomicrobiaceae bacterium]